MNGSRMEKMRAAFLAARDARGDDRARILSEECGDDAALRAEVESLLALHDESAGRTDVLDRSPVAGGPDGAAEVPESIGQFRVVRLIGEGGMGSVYEATQRKPERRVAIKVLRPGVMARETMRRFEREAEVLGRLHHPGIAQIYESGSFGPADRPSRAQPYFAMEFVEGDQLSRFVREKNPSREATLTLFANICDAVEHAHLRGVVHRDLKPANILVEEGTRPKILDFGVARSLDRGAQMTSMRTEVGQIIGTLAYMSPEQVAGRDVDERSDVYSLGVILYELLTGRLPHNISGTSIAEAARAIQHDDPVRPSGIHPSLRGDLETIVLKALERDEERRYPSAGALAEDVRRFLSHRPIAARPPTRWYLFRTFAARNKGVVGGISVAALALAAGMTVSLVMFARAESARKKEQAARGLSEERRIAAEKAQAKAQAINDFLTVDMMVAANDSADPRNIRYADLIQSAVPRVDKRFAGQPEIRGDIEFNIANLFAALDDYENAAKMMKRAVETYGTLGGPPTVQTIQARSLLAATSGSLGRFDEAEKELRETAKEMAAVAGPESSDTLIARARLANVLQILGKHEEARAIFDEVIPKLRSDAGRRKEYFGCVTTLAASMMAQNKVAEAEPLLRDAIALGESDPETGEKAMIAMLNQLAVVDAGLGKYEEALKTYESLLPRAERVFGETVPLGSINLGYARVLGRMDRFEEALPHTEKAFALFDKLLGRSRFETERANSSLRGLYRHLGQTNKLEEAMKRAIELRENVQADPNHESVLGVKEEYAAFLLEHGRAAEARAIMEPVLARAREHLAPENAIRKRIEATAEKAGKQVSR